MIKGGLLVVLFLFIPSLSWAQDDNTKLQTALSANTYLKAEIQQLRTQQQDLLNSFKAISKENSVLKQNLSQARLQPTGTASGILSPGQLLRIRKEIEDAHYNLGVMLQDQDRFDEAQKEYEKVLQINPDDADTHYNLALIFDTGKKDPRQALAHYQKYLNLNPQAPEAQGVRESIARLSR